ncbi:RecB [Desulforapulum autotrophicum HRM2]|uniref:DNA 3'-5' helicase n=1 Tax=Desulforapulum autotrophicum (strain ATCC 43914 / DSM 3382 / VKM B-1955 / HRM2) TaxID=177437 RepID=C0QI07_DESAH|nr:exodeoxyribonuclease V subunit beta [Desulforapulum autotrophicum]ACN15743.1 RecB [Desulforapulum autotrophicum HRM2]
MNRKLDALTFPLHGTRLIEASAGTGKTYTIAALYIRLVLGHGKENGFSRPLVPPEILVVTFTNAATQELRERIRARLTEACAFFRGRGGGDPFLQGLKDDYSPGDLPAMANLLERAALWMDESAIHTIHAWCQRMLFQHAFDSLSLFDLTLEPGDDDLLEEAVWDFWRTNFYPRDVETLQALGQATGLTTPADLLKKVRPLMAGINNADIDAGGLESVPLDPFQMLEQRRSAIEKARRVWQAGFKEAIDLVQKARADKTLNNNRYRPASLDTWIADMDSWVNGQGDLPTDTVLEKFSATGLAQGTSKKGTPPAHPAFDALDRLNDSLGSLDVKQALFAHGAREINDRVMAAKARLSRMGFNDLITRLGQALARPDTCLAQLIRAQFPVAMIDEFQDTDPVQYTLFNTIYLDQEQSGLFMIGDPKQAIYAFRGADIHTYLRARQDAGDRLYTLDKNFRSSSGMVAAVNQIFSHGAKFPLGAFLFKEMIPFDPVLAQDRDETFMVEGQAAVPMTLWQMQDGPVAKGGPDGYLSTMAGAAASEMVRLLNLGQQRPQGAGFLQKDGSFVPLVPSDIAVLVRDVNEARHIRSALDLRGVRSVYLSDRESVFESQEAVSLVYILKACFDPTNERAVRAALATPLLDLSLKTLETLNNDESAWETAVIQFKSFQKTWRTKGVLPMVRALVFEFDVGARLLSTLAGERKLTNLLHLGEILQAESAALDGEQGVIRWLGDQIARPQISVEDDILRLESDQRLVRVITIHKSKGLEYPLVFLPFACSARKLTQANASVVTAHDPDGTPFLVVNPDAKALEAADQERLAEELRMLYVALTRSCFACFLGIGVMGKTLKSGEVTTLHESAMGYLMAGQTMVETAQLPGLLNELKGGSDAIVITPLPPPGKEMFVPGSELPSLLPARLFNGTIPNNWRITSYSGILANAAMPEKGVVAFPVDVEVPDSASQDQLQEAQLQEAQIQEEQIQEQQIQMAMVSNIHSPALSIHGFPRGPEPGTFLHDLLEWAAIQGFDRVAQDRPLALDHIQRACVARGWEPWTGVLVDWLMDFVTVPLTVDGVTFTLADLGKQQCRPEMEFMFASHGVAVGKVDQLVCSHVLPGNLRPVLNPNRLNGMVKGFIDLVFCFKDRYYILDYKSNHLGDEAGAYDAAAMNQAMLGHRYDLQYVLYTLALHRLLKSRVVDYDYDRDLGGAVYLFLRGVNSTGQGVYFDRPPKDLIETLDRFFQGGGEHGPYA